MADVVTGSRARTAIVRRADVVIPLILGLFAVILFLPSIVAGNRTFFPPYDGTEFFYPTYQKLAMTLHRGYLPVWDAHTLSGTSFVGEFQPGIFYPPILLVMALFGGAGGVPRAVLELFVVAHFCLAAAGTHALMRTWGVSAAGAVMAALVFAFSGGAGFRAAAQPPIFFGLSWIPIGMLLLTRALRSGSLKAWAAAGGVVGLQVLAGHVQPAFHTVILYGLYFLAWCLDGAFVAKVRRAVGGIALSAVTLLAVTLPQLYFSWFYLRNAYRWVSAPAPIGPGEKVPFEVYGSRAVIEPQAILNFIDPFKFHVEDENVLYMGIVPLGLVLVFAISKTLRDHAPGDRTLRTFLALAVAFGFLSVFGHYSFMSRVLYAIPQVNQIRELGRYVILINLSLAVVAGLSLDGLVRIAPRLTSGAKHAVLTTAAVLGIEFLYLQFIHNAGIWIATLVGLLLTAALLAAWGLGARRRPLAIGCIGAVAAAIVAGMPALMRAVPRDAQAPALYAGNAVVEYLAPFYGRYRVLLDDSAKLPRNYGMLHPMQTKMGYRATAWRPFFDFISHDWALDSRVNDLLNIRWVVSRTPLPLTLVLDDAASGLKLYERKDFYPRVFFERHLAGPGRAAAAQKYFELLSYSDNYQKYRILMPQEENVIFSEIDYPGWRALVDGTETPITAANIPGLTPLFRQIRLAAGSHTVEFRYPSL